VALVLAGLCGVVAYKAGSPAHGQDSSADSPRRHPLAS
jgi:hypothetical protein